MNGPKVADLLYGRNMTIEAIGSGGLPRDHKCFEHWLRYLIRHLGITNNLHIENDLSCNFIEFVFLKH